MDKFLRVPFWLRFAWYIFANSYFCEKMCGFINANEWIFFNVRFHKQEKTNKNYFSFKLLENSTKDEQINFTT